MGVRTFREDCVIVGFFVEPGVVNVQVRNVNSATASSHAWVQVLTMDVSGRQG